jgi:vacuolar protein sorting-associated protein 29
VSAGKIHQIISTGNLCNKETLDYLRGVCPDITSVHGDYDEISPPQQQQHQQQQHQQQQQLQQQRSNMIDGNNNTDNGCKTLVIGSLRIGIIHAHRVVPFSNTKSLQSIARQLDVDVLVYGSVTHRFEAWEAGAGSSFGDVSNVSSSHSRFYICPGSATGAFTPFGCEGVGDADEVVADKDSGNIQELSIEPSFVLLDVQGSTVVVVS